MKKEAFLLLSLSFFAAAPSRAALAQEHYQSVPDRDPTALWSRLNRAGVVDINGQIGEFGRLRGKIVFVDFWAEWCVDCVVALDRMKRIQAAIADQAGLAFLAIHDGKISNRHPGPDPFLRQHGCFYGTAVDQYGNLTPTYDWIPLVNSLPKYVLFDRSGHIYRRYDESELDRVIDDMKRLDRGQL